MKNEASTKIEFVNISALQQEAVLSLSVEVDTAAIPQDLLSLKVSLQNAQPNIAPLYRTAIYAPLVAFVNSLTDEGFARIKRSSGQSQFFFDFVQVILQHGGKDFPDATGAFEEVVSDLYDGFLSAEDRRNIKLPDHNIIAPIVKWGNPKLGPYTLPSDATEKLKVKCAIISMPPAISKGVLAGWSMLAHETAGHDILHADTGLLTEMSSAVKQAILSDNVIKAKRLDGPLAKYWSTRIDETASDVMGILNMGPAPAAGMIPFFRAFLKHSNKAEKLRSTGPGYDEHPADILRVMLAAAVVQGLSFRNRTLWSEAILTEGLKDIDRIVIDDTVIVDPATAQRSALIVASTLMKTSFATLANHSLQDIQDWTDHDEDIVADLRDKLNKEKDLDPEQLEGIYAAHVVSAAIYEGLLVEQDIAPLFAKMIKALKKMHDANPNWGPLYALQPGNLRIDQMIIIDRVHRVTLKRKKIIRPAKPQKKINPKKRKKAGGR